MDISTVNEYLSNNDNISLVSLIVAIVSLIIAAIGLIISIIVLVLTYKTWKLKSGISVLGWYGVTSSIESNTPYVSEIKLQNTKDKELAISNIYIHFGKNVYIDMLEKDSRFDKYDIVIPPFGSAVLNFGPVFLYSNGTKKANVDELLHQEKGKIVLSTNDGKLTCGDFKKGWDPISDWFKNYGTDVISVNRYYKEGSIYVGGDEPAKVYDFTSFGDRTLYIVTLGLKNGHKVEYPIYRFGEQQVTKFDSIGLTKEALNSKGNLKAFINKQKGKGKIDFETLYDIVDVQDRIKQCIKDFDNEPYIPKAEGWFEYHICDKVQTLWWKLCETKLLRRWCSHYKTPDNKSDQNKY